MKDMVRIAMERLDEGVSQTRDNIGKIYWLNVRIQNNSQQFTNEEIDRAVKLEAELRRVSDCYSDMSQKVKDILLEIDTYVDKAEELEMSGDDNWADELGEFIKFSELNEKIIDCLNESKHCLDMQAELFRKEEEFENTLRERISRKGEWYCKLRSIVRGVQS
jgi:vacuolar-type H+-ATPase subunit I/STV1